MTRKLICLVLACVMMMGLVLTGCKSGESVDTTAAATTAAAGSEVATTAASDAAESTTAPAADLDEVTLTWYNRSNAFAADAFPQKLEVADWLSNYTHEKINANIEYKWFAVADYNEKACAALNASQPMDIIFTSIGNNVNFVTWQKRGAFADITDLIQEYASETYTSIPDWVWKAATVDGKLYAMPSYKDVAVTLGLIYNKTMAQSLGIEEELLGIKWSVAKELDEFYYKVKDLRDAADAEAAKVPLNEWRKDMHIYYEADNLASVAYTSIPGTPSFTGDEYANGTKVFNVYGSQEYADAIAMVTRWVNDEIVPFDQDNWDTEKEIRQSGKMFSRYTWGLVAVDEDEYFESKGWKQGLIQPTVAFTYTGYPQAVMQAVAATSENPERAMMLLNLVFSDQTFSTTLRFGIEGKGWNRVQKDGVDRADFAGTYNEDKQARNDNGFYYWYHAEQGNLFTCLLPLEQNDKFFEYLDAMNASAVASVNMGFVLDPDKISNEIAACESVISEFHDDLITGMESDYENRIAAFNEKLNANGAETIIAEAQAQLDAWRSTNG